MLRVAAESAAHADMAAGLDEIVREGARRMLAAALEVEVEAYLAAHAGERDEAGRRLVVRNGHARPRRVTTAAGDAEDRARRGSTTGGSTRKAGSGAGSAPRSCRRGAGAHRG